MMKASEGLDQLYQLITTITSLSNSIRELIKDKSVTKKVFEYIDEIDTTVAQVVMPRNYVKKIVTTKDTD